MTRKLSIVLVLFLLNSACKAQLNDRECDFNCDQLRNLHRCPPSSCGKIQDITFPFRLKTDPHKCGHKAFTLSCQNNTTKLGLFSEEYTVEAIDYNNQTIRLVDPNILKKNCSSLPSRSLSFFNFTGKQPFEINKDDPNTKSLVLVSCESEVKSSLYLDTSSCSFTWPARHFYALVDGGSSVSTMVESCRVELVFMISIRSVAKSFMDVHDAMAHGFELSWAKAYKSLPFEYEYSYFSTVLSIVGIIVTKIMYGTPILVIFLVCALRRRNRSKCEHIEQFLQNFNDLMPTRYSYTRLRKMSRGFKDKLGQGGYGSVYKGKLRRGRLVAIKMLDNKSKSDGQEFINEVATIGRIHHVNIVRLIGFCAEGSVRALVYEYMPMGSLDKHLFQRDKLCCHENNENPRISFKKMYEISLGVARGIEYLHRGCEMQILHFDIKPHNILLDEGLVPKISDFGLARSCHVDDTVVSLAGGARGTLGYIAPEMVYKNIGGVSNKADVYSFGMLLMEMASRRKNLSVAAERTSQIYFPSWAYERFCEENSMMETDFVAEEDLKIVKKMVIVALFCIQFSPSERPSMNKVIQMLECEIDCLDMPSRPSFFKNSKDDYQLI